MPDLYAHVNQNARLHSSLPRVRLSAAERSAPNLRNPNLAQTRERPTPADVPPEVDVSGQPSIELKLLSQGIAVSIARKSLYTEFMSDSDLDGVREIAGRMLEQEKSMSMGNLTTHQQRLLNHPYGFGRTGPNQRRRGGLGRTTRVRGASNLSVVNRQSGELYDAWEMDFVRSKGGITILLINKTKQAAWTAFGTSKMRAHGPYTTAPALFLAALNREWNKQALRAYHRKQALRGFE